jgi:hypothetical protein
LNAPSSFSSSVKSKAKSAGFFKAGVGILSLELGFSAEPGTEPEFPAVESPLADKLYLLRQLHKCLRGLSHIYHTSFESLWTRNDNYFKPGEARQLRSNTLVLILHMFIYFHVPHCAYELNIKYKVSGRARALLFCYSYLLFLPVYFYQHFCCANTRSLNKIIINNNNFAPT